MKQKLLTVFGMVVWTIGCFVAGTAVATVFTTAGDLRELKEVYCEDIPDSRYCEEDGDV